MSVTVDVDTTPLERTIEGEVVTPGASSWDAARQAWNLAVDQRPAAVVYPTGPDDVARAIAFASERRLPVAVQGTGHGAEARAAIDGSLLLNMARLDGFELDAATRTARVQAGALWLPLVRAADEHGLAALCGSASDVGVVGYTLGGGLGWLARRHGLQANAVTAIELVTAGGELVRADADTEADLFWALRGGGGSFGVVTAIEFGLVPVPEVYAGMVLWPAELAPAVFERYAEWVETVPDELTSLVRLLNFPPFEEVPEPFRGRSFAVVELAYLGSEEDGARLLQPLLDVASPASSTVQSMTPAGLAAVHMDPDRPVPAHGGGHAMLSGLAPDTIAALLDAVGPGSGAPLVSIEARHLGAALAVRTPGAGALAALDGEFAVYAVGIPTSPEVAAAVRDGLDGLVHALEPWSTGGSIPNFGGSPETACLDGDYQRLLAIRAAVDPEGVFRANHRLAP
jgi:FAD/FMN-containing dehydrogenase